MKKYSFLGFILLAASAVTAALIPSKKAGTNAAIWGGHLTLTTGGIWNPTCRRPIGFDEIDCGWTVTGVGVFFSSTSGMNDLNSVSFEEPNFTMSMTSVPDDDLN